MNPWVWYGIYFVVSRAIILLITSYENAKNPKGDSEGVVVWLFTPFLGDFGLFVFVFFGIMFGLPGLMYDCLTEYFQSRFERQKAQLKQQAKTLEFQELRIRIAEQELERELESLRASLQRNT